MAGSTASQMPSSEEIHVYLPIHDQAIRYKPVPLIEDPAVINHTDRLNEGEVEYYSFEPSLGFSYWDPVSDSINGASDLGSHPSLAGLLGDMSTCTFFTGQTTLRVVTYSRRSAEDSEIGADSEVRVRIARCTQHTFQNHTHVSTEAVYDVELLEMLNCTVIHARWLKDIGALLLRTSDRAVRHHEYHRRKQGLPAAVDADVGWKPARRPPYAKYFDRIAVAVNAESVVDESCICCTEPFDNDSKQALALLHDGRHQICRGCLQAWCEEQEGAKARCPTCRKPIWTSRSISKTLVYGVKSDGRTYVSDPRYSEWENHERAQAELDKLQASNSQQDFPITENTTTVLLAFLQHLMEQAALEPRSSTPTHLQPARRPEAYLIIKGVQNALRSSEGNELSTKLVFDLVKLGIYWAASSEYRNSEMRKYMSRDQLNAMLFRPCPATVPLPAGFEEFINRTLNRMLRFYHVRRCKCQGLGGARVHWHGMRMYHGLDE